MCRKRYGQSSTRTQALQAIQYSSVTDISQPRPLHVGTPSYQLRLTLGLRREQERWVVAHEHHSFPLK